MTETVKCDVTELVRLPFAPGSRNAMALLEGTVRQVEWATKIRSDLLDEWEPDLPENVLGALVTLKDATWWIAHRDVEVADIKWPVEWTDRPPKQPRQAKPFNGVPGKVLEDYRKDKPQPAPPAPPAPPAKPVSKEHLENFDQFARTMCKSPELAYLAMVALMVRQNPDPKVRAKYDEVRATIQGHLNAIDNIANS